MTPERLTTDLWHVLVDELLVPEVAVRGDLDQVVGRVKHEVVWYLNHKIASKKLVAELLGRSERWVYRHLEVPEEGRRSVWGTLKEVLGPVPAGVTTKALRDIMATKGYRLRPQEMTGLMALYASLGVVEEHEGRYRLAAGERERPGPLSRTRVAHMRRVLKGLLPLLQGWLAGREGAQLECLRERLLPHHAVAAAEDIYRYASARVLEAVQATATEDPTAEQPRVSFASFLAAGIRR